MPEHESADEKDFVGRRLPFLVAWGLPIGALVTSAFLATRWMVVIWPVSLAWMSISCFVNAVRCGRMHCYFTGWFFLAMCVVSLLHGLDVLFLGVDGWNWLAGVVVVGGVVLSLVPERIGGKHRKARSHDVTG